MLSIVFIEKEEFLEDLVKLAFKEKGVSVFCPDLGVDFIDSRYAIRRHVLDRV